MKKMMKLSKFLLLIVTVFSYISSPISVLAEEVIDAMQKPLVLNLMANEGSDDYSLTFMNEVDGNYEDEKIYKIELDTTVTYTNGTEEILSENEVSVDGATLNTVDSSYTLSNPVLEHYNGEYTLEVTVYDGTIKVYNQELEYDTDYSAPVGLNGKLINDLGEEISPVKDSNYDVTEGKYTQNLNILTGELSPNGLYRISGTEEVMTGEVLRGKVFTGNETDLTGKLFGTYSNTDSITIEEVTGNETDGYEVVRTYTYSFETTLNYGTTEDNDSYFTDMYGITFEDGYMIVPAKGMDDAESVITVEELVEKLDENTTLIVNNGDEEILSGEVKNGFVVSFTNGATASYEVIVKGDADSDNDFDNDDLTGVMEGYLEEENMPSMDMVTLEEETVDEEEPIKEEFGTITFEDVVFVNELLKGENADFTEKEIGGATVIFGELPELVYVGDTFDLEVLVSSEVAEELIDGLDGAVTLGNLKLDGVSYSSSLVGVSNDEGRVVAVASEGLSNGTVVLTFTFTATEEGTGTINFDGNVYRYMDSNEFNLSGEVNIERKISSNSYLSALNASVGSFDIEFNREETVYTLTVPYDTEKVILSGALEDLNAEVDGLIEYELTDDKTTAIITVTAEDGSTTVYTVYIVKEKAPVTKPVVYYYSSNNYLESLEVEGYELEFDKNTNEYKITVGNDVTSLDIKALAEHSRARVEITGNSDFEEGENTVVITVTAENGSTREYKLIVTREAKKQAVVTDTENSSNTTEKIVIMVLIILVVLGLLYLIFKKDEEENEVKTSVKKEEPRNNKNNDSNKNTKNNKKKRKK